ncbi:MAG: DUF3179 domain-containing protein [Salinibacter sp.]
MLHAPVRTLTVLVLVAGLSAFSVSPAVAQSLPDGAPQALQQFDTDWRQHTIDLASLKSGGPSKDQIPAIDDPSFVSIDQAHDWIDPQEPVIAVTHEGVTRAYPLQILTWHEIVNDRLGDTPVAVTFCPLCYSALVFDRRVEGETLSFGVSGLLRHSDLVMYDRGSETLWQQFTGEAIVGTRTGDTLRKISSQILSFDQFATAHPDAEVLSRETGHQRPYGRNPYAGYDDVETQPFMLDGPTDGRLPPMEKVVAVTVNDTHKAYRRTTTQEQHVLHDTVAGRPLVVFHAPGAVSALDARTINQSKEIGATGVYDRRVDGRTLTFQYDGDGDFTDEATGSTWSVTGRAQSGPLEGTQLERIEHGDYFAFAWFAFRPNGVLYTADGS